MGVSPRMVGGGGVTPSYPTFRRAAAPDDHSAAPQVTTPAHIFQLASFRHSHLMFSASLSKGLETFASANWALASTSVKTYAPRRRGWKRATSFLTLHKT